VLQILRTAKGAPASSPFRSGVNRRVSPHVCPPNDCSPSRTPRKGTCPP
jgi:hypothetical protein